MPGILTIGITGLAAAQSGLVTTSHNIANASVEGYSRQSIVQSSQTGVSSGSGFFGQGTQVETVKRSYNQYLTQQVMSADTKRAQYETYAGQIAQIDDLLADSDVGLSSAMESFFAAVQDVASSPANIASRQSLISAGETLASRFQSIDGRLSEIRDGVEGEIASTVTEINAYAQEIADINQKIVVAEGVAGQPANDLRDQRDQLIVELNRLVRASTIEERDGSVSVFIGSGQSLVIGTIASELAAVPSASDASRYSVALVTPSGTNVTLPESLLDGGKLGGLLSFRSETLDATQDGLGDIALAVADAFNTQHGLGQDLYGNLGGDFFTFTSGAGVTSRTAAQDIRVSSAIANDPKLVAAASPVVLSTASTNTGTGAMTGLTVDDTTGLPLAGSISIVFDAGTSTFNISGATPTSIAYDPATQSTGASFTLTSPTLSFTISGVPADGDSFTLGANATGVSDNSNAVALGNLQVSKTMFGGTATFNTAYARIVNDVGNTARKVQVNEKAQTNLLLQAETARQSVAGVNLDEEASNLIRYQQAYQAAARVMQVASTLFDEVLAIGR
jgi:flagellar hook-associated protein 1 FlgK